MQVILALLLVLFAACTQKTVDTSAPSTPTPTPVPMTTTSLDWEKNHPERAAWSKTLTSLLEKDFVTFDRASDSDFFCPNYEDLDHDKRVRMWAGVVVWTAYYESSWDPTSSSVDVGEDNDKDTWSVGLMQVSVDDQPNYGFKFGYTFDDLQQATPNLTLAMAIMNYSVASHGKLLIDVGEKGLYWATLHPGGKYDKSAAIAAKVLAFIPSCRATDM